jgi:hypothetical protein
MPGYVNVDLRPILELIQKLATPREELENQQLFKGLGVMSDPHISETLSQLPKQQQGEIFRRLFTYNPPLSRRLLKGESRKTLLWPEQVETIQPEYGDGEGVRPTPWVKREPTFFKPPRRNWAPGSKEEYLEVHPLTSPNWGPKTREEYLLLHPPKPTTRFDNLKDEEFEVDQLGQEVPGTRKKRWQPKTPTAPTRETEKKTIGGVVMERRTQFNPESGSWEPLPGAEWTRVHEPPQPRRTEEEEFNLFKKKHDYAESGKKEKGEQPPNLTLSPATRKDLKNQLLRIYLSDPSPYFDKFRALNKRLETETGETVSSEDLYNHSEFGDRDRALFDRIAGMAEPYLKQLGVYGALNQALKDYQLEKKSSSPVKEKGVTSPPIVTRPGTSKFEILEVR